MKAKRENIFNQENSSVLYLDKVTTESLRQLINPDSNVLAIVINDFADSRQCEYSSRKIRSSKSKTAYKVAEGIQREGDAIYDAADNPEQLKVYLKNITKNHKRIRDFFPDGFSPIDKLRLQLQEEWPQSSTLGNFANNPAFAGLVRYFKEGTGGAGPHTDVVSWDLPEDMLALAILFQIAANVYLSMPEKGGELTLWDFGLYPEKTYKAYLDKSSAYALDLSLLPPPSVTITPKVGQLILFNASLVHSVSDSFGGDRITTSTFIGYVSDDQPLKIFS